VIFSKREFHIEMGAGLVKTLKTQGFMHIIILKLSLLEETYFFIFFYNQGAKTHGTVLFSLERAFLIRTDWSCSTLKRTGPC
jgi:hypothetical protein